jgi:hypothetical protein
VVDVGGYEEIIIRKHMLAFLLAFWWQCRFLRDGLDSCIPFHSALVYVDECITDERSWNDSKLHVTMILLMIFFSGVLCGHLHSLCSSVQCTLIASQMKVPSVLVFVHGPGTSTSQFSQRDPRFAC